MNLISGILLFLTALITLIAGAVSYIEVIYRNRITNMETDSIKILKILQEIACDYRVRIIKSGLGNTSASVECVYMGVNNDIPYYSMEYTEKGKSYLINFRVFGKCYLANADSEIAAWAIVISKAREESRNIFGRTGYLDKHKIQ